MVRMVERNRGPEREIAAAMNTEVIQMAAGTETPTRDTGKKPDKERATDTDRGTEPVARDSAKFRNRYGTCFQLCGLIGPGKA